jgi:imidazole glycerol-phosphate synthase subunit HisH
METCVLIDYGSGNLRSAEKALLQAASNGGDAVRVIVTAEPEAVAKADRLVLPGVGAFAACIGALNARDGLVEAMTAAKDRDAPFLGVCVGMQLLASRGLEFGETAGLDWIGGEVRRIEPQDRHLKVPHMGWNALETAREHPILEGLAPGAHMYFTHSFAFHASDEADVAAWTDHGGRFAAAVARDNVAGVQFHPEKSQAAGLTLLQDFLEWRP